MKKTSLNNKKGIALVTSLLMTFISLTIVMAVMYMITANIQKTGVMKRYKSALEATYGGTDAVVKQVFPKILDSAFAGNNENFTLFTVSFPNNANCSISSKITSSPDAWAAACSQSPDPKTAPDISFQLPASVGGQSYTVYAKIIDTIVGNTDMSASGGDALTGGVVETLGAGGISVKHIPYVYRLEVQAERSTGATEQANLTVLYAY